MTRARRYLFVTWPADSRGGPSPFVAELGWEPQRPPGGKRKDRSPVAVAPAKDGDLYEALRRWRRERASRDGVPAYVVFHDATLVEIADRSPRTSAALLAVPGVGPAKLERYGPEVLALLSSA